MPATAKMCSYRCATRFRIYYARYKKLKQAWLFARLIVYLQFNNTAKERYEANTFCLPRQYLPFLYGRGDYAHYTTA